MDLSNIFNQPIVGPMIKGMVTKNLTTENLSLIARDKLPKLLNKLDEIVEKEYGNKKEVGEVLITAPVTRSEPKSRDSQERVFRTYIVVYVTKPDLKAPRFVAYIKLTELISKIDLEKIKESL